MSQRHYCK